MLSYIITTFAPKDVNKRFVRAKKDFSSMIMCKKKRGVIITQNMAHITIKRTFYLKPGIDEGVIVKALNEITFKPISVFADRLAVFRSEKLGNILVALVSKSPELLELYDRLTRAVDRYIEYEEKEFVPHLSILYYLSKDRIREAKTYAKKNIMPISFMLDNFNLLKDTEVVKERVVVKRYYPMGI